jgi:hypothetical protein
LFYRNVDTLEVGDGVTFTTHGNKPVMVQPTTKDSTYIKKADGVDFFVSGQTAAVTGDGIVVKNRNTAVGYKEGADAWYWSGDLTVHTETIPNLYTGANWINRGGEVNASTGIIEQGVTVASETINVADGTYSMSMTNSDGTADRAEVDLTLANSTTYTVRWYEYNANGSSQIGTFSWIGFTNTSPTPSTTGNTIGNMVEKEVTVTTNATTQKMRFYNQASTGSGNRQFIDALQIIEN